MVMAINIDITIEEIARIFLRKPSLIERQIRKLIIIIKNDAMVAINKPRVVVSCALPAGLP
jgi:hypothetical protein